jgi:hypothetical protein
MFQNQICSGDFEDLAGTKQPGETPSTGTHYYRLPPGLAKGKLKNGESSLISEQASPDERNLLPL